MTLFSLVSLVCCLLSESWVDCTAPHLNGLFGLGRHLANPDLKSEKLGITSVTLSQGPHFFDLCLCQIIVIAHYNYRFKALKTDNYLGVDYFI